jgi:hypothetical protein
MLSYGPIFGPRSTVIVMDSSLSEKAEAVTKPDYRIQAAASQRFRSLPELLCKVARGGAE